MSKYQFLLPAYKPEFLAEALKSIQQQTYRDFTCLVSDDCSPADLKLIFDQTVGDDSRFSFRRNKENLGGKSLVSHWNLLVNMCDSPYLIMASDDDLYDTSFLSEIDVLTEKYPKTLVFRGGARRIYREGESFFEDYKWHEWVSSLHFAFDMFSTYYIHCMANYVFQTRSMKANGGFIDYPLAWFSDDATVLRESVNGVANTPDVVFSFRYSKLNLSDNIAETPANNWSKYQATIRFYDWAMSYLKSFEANLPVSDRVYHKVSIWGIWGKVQEQVWACLPKMSYSQFIIAYKWLSQHGLIDGIIKKIQIMRCWLKHKG